MRFYGGNKLHVDTVYILVQYVPYVLHSYVYNILYVNPKTHTEKLEAFQVFLTACTSYIFFQQHEEEFRLLHFWKKGTCRLMSLVNWAT